MSDEEITRTVLAVCLGNQTTREGIIGTFFSILDEDGETMTKHELGYKKLPKCRAGGVYRLVLTASNARRGDPEYVGPLRDEDERMAIMTVDNAREVSRRAKQKQVQDTYLTPLVMKRMEPLRTAYDKLDYHGKRALELAVLEWLRR